MTDDNSSWPPPPETPGWPPSAVNAKNEDIPLSVFPFVFGVAARLVLNLLCFCLTASLSLIAAIFLFWTGMPWLVALLLWIMLAGIRRLVRPPWVKAALYSGAWGAGTAALCLVAFQAFLYFMQGG